MTGACSLLIPRGQWRRDGGRSQCHGELLVWHEAGRREWRETARLGFPGPGLASANSPEKEGCQGGGGVMRMGGRGFSRKKRTSLLDL